MASVESMKKFPTEEDALAFIAQIKRTLRQPNQVDNKYDQFVRALLDFDERKITPESLVFDLQSLFHGHEDLLRGFKFFCPDSRQPVIGIPVKKINHEFDDYQKELSYEFLNEVKERFRDNPETYIGFLDALIMYGDCTLRKEAFCQKLVQLFFGHADLLCKFVGYFDNDDVKFGQELEQLCRFEIDGRLEEIQMALSNLRTAIACVEMALREKTISKVAESVEREFGGIKVMRIKRTFPENSDEVMMCLRRDPMRALPSVLDQLREKELRAQMDRSVVLKFAGEILPRKCNSKKRGRDLIY